MTERAMTYVVSDAEAVTNAYLARGYQRSERTPQQQLGPLYERLPPDLRTGLVVLEIAADKHTELQRPTQKFKVEYIAQSYAADAQVVTYDVLGTDDYWSGRVVVARADVDESAVSLPAYEFFETAELARSAGRMLVMQHIETHRAAIVRLQKFLEEK